MHHAAASPWSRCLGAAATPKGRAAATLTWLGLSRTLSQRDHGLHGGPLHACAIQAAWLKMAVPVLQALVSILGFVEQCGW
jgi:hypothetical protein